MGILFLAPDVFDFLMWPVTALMAAADALIRLWI